MVVGSSSDENFYTDYCSNDHRNGFHNRRGFYYWYNLYCYGRYKKPLDEQMTEFEKTKMMSEFSKGLTLWGSNKVVKKWLKYRKASLENMSPESSLLLLEDIIYEIRKDVGQRKKLGKGDMLSIFINDTEKIIKKK